MNGSFPHPAPIALTLTGARVPEYPFSMVFRVSHILSLLAAFSTLLPDLLLVTSPSAAPDLTCSVAAACPKSDDVNGPCCEIVEEDREEQTETKVHLFLGGCPGAPSGGLAAWAAESGGCGAWPPVSPGMPAIRGPPAV